jgi:hypothetical protein
MLKTPKLSFSSNYPTKPCKIIVIIVTIIILFLIPRNTLHTLYRTFIKKRVYIIRYIKSPMAFVGVH